MAKINREWHAKHKMPENPSVDQRIAWHLDHARNCGCRKIDGGVAALLRERGMPIPELNSKMAGSHRH
jgi:hypothetical protein